MSTKDKKKLGQKAASEEIKKVADFLIGYLFDYGLTVTEVAMQAGWNIDKLYTLKKGGSVPSVCTSSSPL